MLGLPDVITTCLFDLDGVLTDTASVHSVAWKEAFDRLLHRRGTRPFRVPDDYDGRVDGKPREAGVRDFLASRDIWLPDGDADDAAGISSVHALAALKNDLLLERIRRDGVRVYESSRDYLTAARDAGLRRAVVSSSTNTREVLDMTGLTDLVENVVDGNTLHDENLAGKPASDSFLAAAAEFGSLPEEAAVFEDALSGVEAGRAGGFGHVVGVNRKGAEHGCLLHRLGADTVVFDLQELL